jgi:hypothetical protein
MKEKLLPIYDMKIEIPVYWYEDENGVIHYDFEEMARYYENEILNLTHS